MQLRTRFLVWATADSAAWQAAATIQHVTFYGLGFFSNDGISALKKTFIYHVHAQVGSQILTFC